MKLDSTTIWMWVAIIFGSVAVCAVAAYVAYNLNFK